MRRLAIQDSNGDKAVKRASLQDLDKHPVQTVPQAITALNRLKAERADDDLPVFNRTPKWLASQPKGWASWGN